MRFIPIFLTALLLLPLHALAVTVGEKAPLFEAPSTHGVLKLKDYLGRKYVVLAFYFKDFTSGWTSEMQAFQKDIKKFESLNAQVLGISPDDVETHMKFSRELGLEFPLIADTEKKLQAIYKSGRVTFVVDKQGVIRFIQEGMPQNDVLLEEIRKIEQAGK